MKPFSQQNYYEVLEVPPDELPLGIRRAYKKAFELYQAGSSATYSFFSEAERKEILACIEQAYLTLINQESRAAYDRSLTAPGLLEEGSSPAKQSDELKSRATQNPAIHHILAQDTLAGSDVQALRANLQVSLEEIAEQTNIPIDILHAMERGDIDLPSPLVYLKGFLKSYAICLKLDEQVIVKAYLKKQESSDHHLRGIGEGRHAL